MLNQLKIAIKQKKLYFVVESSFSNIDKFNFLLLNNILTGFVVKVSKKKTFLVGFINYNYNLLPVINEASKISDLNCLQTNNLHLNSNFIINMNTLKKKTVNQIKFR